MFFYLYWLFVGWVGAIWRDPGYPDEGRRGTRWVTTRVVGALAGIVGGVVFNRVFVGANQIPFDSFSSFIVTGIGAVLFGAVASDLATGVSARNAAASATSAR